MKDFIKINENDNVVVALRDLDESTVLQISNEKITLKEPIKMGHKISVSEIKAGNNIIKYGLPIGHALCDILPGKLIHTHNIKTNLSGINEYVYEKELNKNEFKKMNLFFKGYRRKNGDVGIRNELWIVPTVGCINGTADKIVKKFKEEFPETEVNVLKHNYGCSQLGDDHFNTRTILCDIVKHPNAGGVLVLGLGCENNNMYDFKKSLGSFDETRIRFLISQEVSDEIKEGSEILKELYKNMICDKREDIPISELKIGLKCGASDGFSGITANPLLGKFSDFLAAQDGTTVLTEVPEMFGAETLLMKRARNKNVFNKTVKMINDFKEYFIKYDQPVYENPSPGNKAGGITTLEDKSLGCTQKSGTAEIVDVLNYGETLKEKGLNLLSAPGNDLVAATALAASGCHMVLFTTGRGTPFGSFVPTIKISTNSSLYNMKPHWIDFNAGTIVEDNSLQELFQDFLFYILNVASGKFVNNEKNDFRGIAIFKSGVTL